MVKRVIIWLLSVGLMLWVWGCVFFVSGFQKIMGNEGRLLEAWITIFFIIETYRLIKYRKLHRIKKDDNSYPHS